MTRILALDPSTGTSPGTGCGVALIEYPSREILAMTTCIPVDGGDRLDRIRYIRRQVEDYAIAWTGRAEMMPTHIAFEQPYQGKSVIEAIHWLTGALLSIPALAHIPTVPISASEAKSAWSGTGLKRVDAKQAVVLWARRVYGARLGPDQHDMADALAVAEAAWSRVRAGQLADQPRQQLALSLPNRRKARR